MRMHAAMADTWHAFVTMHQQPSPSPSPETAGHEAPDDKHTGGAIMPSSAAASTAAEERLNALVLSTPRATGSSGLRASSAGASAARSTTTPLSSAKASRSVAVVGDGTFEELMKERARVSCSTGSTSCVQCVLRHMRRIRLVIFLVQPPAGRPALFSKQFLAYTLVTHMHISKLCAHTFRYLYSASRYKNATHTLSLWFVHIYLIYSHNADPQRKG